VKKAWTETQGRKTAPSATGALPRPGR